MYPFLTTRFKEKEMPHQHWLMTREEVMKKLEVDLHRMQRLTSLLLALVTPASTRLFPRRYINQLIIFLDGREAVPALVREFAGLPEARQLMTLCKKYLKSEVKKHGPQLTIANITSLLPVSIDTVSRWSRAGKLPLLQAAPGYPNVYGSEAFLSACAWQCPA